MKRYLAMTAFVAAVATPSMAFAYVGPGAGLSLLGALGALLAAIGAALFFVVAWPVRKMMRQRAAAKNANGAQATDNRSAAAGPRS